MGSEDNNVMNGAQIHLFLVHLPVTGFFFLAVLLMVGRIFKSEDLLRWTRTGAILLGALAVITYLTGEGAEEVLESLDLADKTRIEAHESVALISMLLGLASGLAHGFLQWQKKSRKNSRTMFLIADAMVVIAALSFGWTAHKGGLIRHLELEISGPEEAKALKEKSLDSGFLKSESGPKAGNSESPQSADRPETSAAPNTAEAPSGGPPREFGTGDGSQKLKIIDGPIQDVPNIDQEPDSNPDGDSQGQD